MEGAPRIMVGNRSGHSADNPGESRASPPGRLRIERSGAVGELVIDNPSRRNALSKAMWRHFGAAVEQLDADKQIKVIVVRGAGTHFSAGVNLPDLQAVIGNESTRNGGDVTGAEEALASATKPTVAAIDGYCVGGGWELAGACDIRIASSRASIGITAGKIGIVYPTSGIRRLVELAGAGRAKYLLLSGNLISAEEALVFGLVSKVVAPAHLHDQVRVLAEKLANRSQLSAQAHKDLVDAIASGGTEVIDRSVYWQDQQRQSPDALIGIRAFINKEPPAFEWSAPTERYRGAR
ncbi:enoyl-CoA hydratase/isomerase family protein [Arthrobacter sp. AFG20]|uniref:enoyl-CoA hydratase/isomerase family protein n=1 Tax=Arthrobacter sp. AFG20 TaxID=1688671 RepID=UPI000C9EAFA5|nr:enoyl-CoA hydratase/isomerase family protein [Arthrobacter sp. AFG20]PNH78935.1 enoyl-CoA hydratase [Arthrobacter sp. AFG20]